MLLTFEQLQKENDILRGIVAFSDIPCLYCGLSLADMPKCLHGFPGCGRADDQIAAPEHIQQQYGAPK